MRRHSQKYAVPYVRTALNEPTLLAVLNAKKSQSWTTESSREGDLQGLSLMGEEVPSSKGGRLLGAHVAVRRGVKNTLGEKRVKRGIVVGERVRWAPSPCPAVQDFWPP